MAASSETFIPGIAVTVPPPRSPCQAVPWDRPAAAETALPRDAVITNPTTGWRPVTKGSFARGMYGILTNGYRTAFGPDALVRTVKLLRVIPSPRS